jgi:hypothetical protein
MIPHIAYITNPIMNVIVHCHILGSSATKANIFSMDDLGFHHSFNVKTVLHSYCSVGRLQFSSVWGCAVAMLSSVVCDFSVLGKKQQNELFPYDTTYLSFDHSLVIL